MGEGEGPDSRGAMITLCEVSQDFEVVQEAGVCVHHSIRIATYMSNRKEVVCACVINPRRACAARVTVLALCVCVFVCYRSSS